METGGRGGAGASASLRLAELVAALSLATDLGTGQPQERALRTCLLAVHLGGELGLGDDELAAVYYVALLRFVGCTADMRALAALFGDEQAAQARVATLELLPAQMIAFLLRHAGEGAPPLARARHVAGALARGPGQTREAAVAHCEVSQRIARRLGLGDAVDQALGSIYERWDGRGVPGRARGEALPIAMRLVHLAQDADLYHRLGGASAAVAMARERAGGYYDPALVRHFCRRAPDLLLPPDAAGLWERALDAEPGPRPSLAGAQLDTAARAIADFTDLRSPYTHGHSSRVAALAAAAAERCGLVAADVVAVRRAALLHDVGRVGVSLSLWDKPGPLTAMEWERVRLYPYYTERVLARPPALARLGAIAGLQRERLDGSGYPRGLPAALLPPPARLLAVADAYQAMIEPRAYRPARPPEAAAAELRREVRAGKLDGEAVAAVFAAVGGGRAPVRRGWPAGLSEREVVVLRLVARGLSNREMAARLGISPKTVGHHVQHIYDKVGVSTRAAATLFALQHDLLDPGDALPPTV